MYFIHPSQGKLTGKGIEDQLPTIAIVTHYDSFGIAPVSMNLLSKVHLGYFPIVCEKWIWRVLSHFASFGRLHELWNDLSVD